MSNVQVSSNIIPSLDEQKQISLFSYSNFKYRQSDVSILIVFCEMRVFFSDLAKRGSPVT